MINARDHKTKRPLAFLVEDLEKKLKFLSNTMHQLQLIENIWKESLYLMENLTKVVIKDKSISVLGDQPDMISSCYRRVPSKYPLLGLQIQKTFNKYIAYFSS